MPVIPFEKFPSVAIFWSIADEIDTEPLRLILAALDIEIGLPRIVEKGEPLIFHRWQPADELVGGPLGVQEPSASALSFSPDVIIVPLLGFDNDGYRLGYGGGFYDRTLRLLRQGPRHPLSIGFAFDCQRLDRVPRESQDEPVDFVVTDAQIYRCSS